MASQGISRKRPAPGASPVAFQQQQQAAPGYSAAGSQLSNDQFLQWGQNLQAAGNGTPSNEASTYNGQNLTDVNSFQPSSQLTRRNGDQQLMNRPSNYPDSTSMQWLEPSNGSIQPVDGAWGDDLPELERKAQVAKRDAQAKRKQIPPFVQKLSSFLNEEKNTDLIRWSDDGNSFIVLDEDEFARKLIPELFKHNNYASFVRQLNMYGFHKKVGLSDNSMRASERKNKSPSEYSNPYFRRGHPDLLWLIQKPKNVTGQGSKAKGRAKNDTDQNEDDNEDEYIEEIAGTGQGNDGHPKARPQLAIGQGDSGLPQSQLIGIRQELQTIRNQQQLISKMIAQIKREHEHLYGQAANFQDQHSRHENSINAILSFLASFYNNRNLQNSDGPQGLANMFAGTIPHEQTSGNVVDVGDFSFDEAPEKRPFKKQQLLLSAPPKTGTGPQSAASTATSPQIDRPQTRRMSQPFRNGQYQSGNVEEVFDPETPSNRPSSHESAAQLHQSTAYPPQSDILSMIQNSNARRSSGGTSASELPAALTSLQNSAVTTPLTPTQRDDMLRLMNNSSTTGPNGPDNALAAPSTPATSRSYNAGLANTKADIDKLADMQAEQDRSVQNLTNLLQPLSPSGSIPGIGDGANVPPPALDLDQIFNSGDYFSDFPLEGNMEFNSTNNGANNGIQNTAGLNSFNFDDIANNGDELFGDVQIQPNDADYDGGDYQDDQSTVHGKVESMPSSSAPSPANTIGSEGVKRDRPDSGSLQSPPKRRRRNA